MALECCYCFDTLAEGETTFEELYFADEVVLVEVEKEIQAVCCDEGHVTCYNCLQTAIANAVGDQKELVCGDGSQGFACKSTYSDKALDTAVTDEKLRTAYDKMIASVSVSEAKVNGLYACPFCANGAIIEIPLGESPCFSCLNCNKPSCRSCRKDWHEGPCHPEEHSKEEDETKRNILVCCGKSFIRGDGCNKVPCPTCRGMWCWICKQSISKTVPYEHFDDVRYNGKGVCKLFGDPDPIPAIPENPTNVTRTNAPPPQPLPREPRNVIKCAGIKQNGTRCGYTARNGIYCRIHSVHRPINPPVINHPH